MMTDIEDRSTCYNALGQLCNAPPPNTPLNTGVGAVWRVYSIEKSLLLLSPPLQQGGGQKGLAPPHYEGGALAQGGWEEEQGLFNTVHSPHCPHSHMEGGWEEALYACIESLLCRTNKNIIIYNRSSY